MAWRGCWERQVSAGASGTLRVGLYINKMNLWTGSLRLEGVAAPMEALDGLEGLLGVAGDCECLSVVFKYLIIEPKICGLSRRAKTFDRHCVRTVGWSQTRECHLCKPPQRWMAWEGCWESQVRAAV
jgi:hypothetical protein